MTAEEKAQRLNELSLEEHERNNLKPYKSYEDAFRKQVEYLLKLAQSVAAQRNISQCTWERLYFLLEKIVGIKSMSESDMREMLLSRKRKIGFDNEKIQEVFGAAASTGRIYRNGKTAEVKLYSHKLSLEQTKRIIKALLPIGLETQYVLSGNEWGYFEGKNFSFSQLDSMGLSWAKLDKKEW